MSKTAEISIHAHRKVFKHINDCVRRGDAVCAIQGGRRAGKTYNIAIWLLLKVLQGESVLCATMTNQQGRCGIYTDFRSIIFNAKIFNYFDILQSPREIRSKVNNGVVIFSSFQDSETAKGVAVDYLFINEANKFSYNQFVDLSCNVRKLTILDYNPNIEFWVKDLKITPLLLTWKDNPYLTPIQLKWFQELKERASSPNATSLDQFYYKVYYLGEYAEIDGAIFTRANLQLCEKLVSKNLRIFCDPSALRGADYFACVLSSYSVREQELRVIDMFAPNTGSRADIVRKILEWQSKYDVKEVFVETNGIIGVDFFEFAQNSGIQNLRSWYSRGNKYERILSNYQNITEKIFFYKNIANLDACIKQITDFSKKCEHDDIIDAVNSSWAVQYYRLGAGATKEEDD